MKSAKYSLAGQLPGLLLGSQNDVINVTGHVERGLGEVVELALNDTCTQKWLRVGLKVRLRLHPRVRCGYYCRKEER